MGMLRHRPLPTIAGATDAGPRAENQDRWAAGPTWALVCDGVGGHAGGATAAALARDVVTALLASERPRTAGAAERLLARAAAAANEAVHEGRAAGSDVADMATTLTAAVALDRRGAGRRWVAVQVGDSPAWQVGPATARTITWDHNLVGDLVRVGALAPDQAIGHRGRHIVTRVLGAGPTVDPEVFTVDLAAGDALVLASDGLSDVVGPEAAVAPCATADVGGAARDLVALALAAGTMDNVTVVVAR